MDISRKSRSRIEIEKEASENRFYQNNSKSQHDSILGGLLTYNFPAIFPNINMDLLFDFDQMAHENDKKEEHLEQRIGDFPVEMIDNSQSVQDLHLESKKIIEK